MVSPTANRAVLDSRGNNVAAIVCMASNRTYHVVPDASHERWLVTEENAEFRRRFRKKREFRTKEEAVNAAEGFARSHEPSQVKVHKSDGRLEHESTYGGDPRRTTG